MWAMALEALYNMNSVPKYRVKWADMDTPPIQFLLNTAQPNNSTAWPRPYRPSVTDARTP